MLEFDIAGLTHTGRQRPSNEDHVVVDAAHGLAIVADGMGGERAGEVAAEAGCRSITEFVRSAASDAPALHSALDAAASRVLELGRVAGHDGMGSTIAAVRIVAAEAIAEIGHVGDVRVYIVRKTTAATVPAAAPRYCPPTTTRSGSVMVCATRDHSSVCELVERGHLERAAAARHPLRSRISRALGREDARHELCLVPLLAGDRIVVCSDGLWSMVDDATIARIVEEQPAPEPTCQALLAAALAAGGVDNIGIAVLHWNGARLRDLASAPSPAAAVEPPAPSEVPLPRALAPYCRDLTSLARKGELDPVIGREREVVELARALVQRRKSNALLLGEPGVGKTSVVEALAQRVVAANTGDEVARLRIVELSLTELIAGTKLRGELEERIQAVLDAAEQDSDLVLFIDELHAIAQGTGDSPGAALAGALKPALARGRLRVIGATTTAEYERHLARDEAFTRRFEIIPIAEPTPAQTRVMLGGLRARLESHYRARLDDSALDAAIELSIRYMPDRRLPDKAVDLLDRACSRRMLETLSRRSSGSSAPITRRDVASAVADRCRLPLALVERDAGQVLASVEAALRDRIKGQDAAIATIAATLRRAHTPLRDPQRPLASFLLAGPTGVGKTATARAIAESLFGRDALVRIDMSELGERQGVARLIGAPPGYAGHGDEGQLTGPVGRKPAAVVLLDEIEKAHPDVLMLLLQVLGDGQLTDGRGRTTSFREAIIVMTTNLPLGEVRRPIRGFAAAAESLDGDDRDLANRQALAQRLRPELVGRIDAVVPFRALETADHAAIVDAVVARLEARLRAQGVAPPAGDESRRRVLGRLDALGFGVRQVERIAEQVIAEALDAEPAEPRDNVILDSIRTRVHVAMLLVDIVGSTRLLADAGETQYVGTVRRLVEAVRCHETASDVQFLKCTGDGVLALYGNVDSAVEAGADLQEIVTASQRVKLRRVVHYGRVRHGPVGDFLGVELHRVFRIEALATDDRIGEGPPLPQARLLVTAAARDRLEPEHRDRLTPAGMYRLTGFGEPVELWLYPQETAS